MLDRRRIEWLRRPPRNLSRELQAWARDAGERMAIVWRGCPSCKAVFKRNTRHECPARREAA